MALFELLLLCQCWVVVEGMGGGLLVRRWQYSFGGHSGGVASDMANPHTSSPTCAWLQLHCSPSLFSSLTFGLSPAVAAFIADSSPPGYEIRKIYWGRVLAPTFDKKKNGGIFKMFVWFVRAAFQSIKMQKNNVKHKKVASIETVCILN